MIFEINNSDSKGKPDPQPKQPKQSKQKPQARPFDDRDDEYLKNAYLSLEQALEFIAISLHEAGHNASPAAVVGNIVLMAQKIVNEKLEG